MKQEDRNFRGPSRAGSPKAQQNGQEVGYFLVTTRLSSGGQGHFSILFMVLSSALVTY